MSEFEKCLKRGTLRHFDNAGRDVVEAELRAARKDLADADYHAEFSTDAADAALIVARRFVAFTEALSREFT